MKPGIVVLALLSSGPALAQIAPGGPPQNAPPAAEAPAKPALSEQEARQKLTASGYPDVHDLKRGQQGEWTGTASVSGQQRPVRVEADGTVRPGN